MSISAILGTAVSGMNAQTNRLNSAANTIARSGIAESQPEPQQNDGDDMLGAMTDMMDAETSFKANAAAFETGASMWDALMAMVKD